MKAEDYQLWLITLKGSLVPTKVKTHGTKVPKTEDEFDANHFRMMEKNAKAIKILYFGLGIDEYNRISGCSSAKEIWDSPTLAHEGTN